MSHFQILANGALEIEKLNGELVSVARRNVGSVSEQGDNTLITPTDGAPFLTCAPYEDVRAWWEGVTQ